MLPKQWRGWSTEKLTAVLAHESAHIQRRDGLVSFLAELSTILYWFNPIVWIAKVKLGRLAELSCDQSAALDTGSRLDYARQLLEIAASNTNRRFQPGIAMASHSEMVDRIESLLDTGRPLTRRISKVILLSMILVGVPALLLVAAAQPSGDQTNEPTQASKIELENDDWIRIDGERLFMTFRGEVLMPDGSPANEVDVRAATRTEFDVKLDGNKFEFEAEIIKRGHQPGVSISASAADGKWMADYVLFDFAARSAASRTIRIRLEETRTTRINVVYEGKPVRNALVAVDASSFHDVVGTTDDDGAFIATTPKSSKIDRISAWKDENLIGGYWFDRGPVRDPNNSQQTIEMSKCRSQKMRIVDEEGNPVVGLPFKTEVASLPHHNYIPRKGRRQFVTDENGEAIDPWFPDWEQVHFYIELDDREQALGWFKTADEKLESGTFVARLGKSKTLKRHRITGQIELPDNVKGGFRVELGSFQHPQEGRYDRVFARSDADGKFSADVMPGATYSVFVNDADWVSEPWTGILHDPEKAVSKSLELKISNGEPVEVDVTFGPDHQPMANTYVSFQTRTGFTWIENGKPQSGSLGRQWWVATDENGRATTRASSGELNLSIYNPDWRPSQKASVESGKTTKIKFHRKSPGKRKITGRVHLADRTDAAISGTEVKLFAMDQSTRAQSETQVDNDGRFSVEMAGARIAVFAKSRDGKAAGSFIADHPDQGIKIELLPVARYRGQLLGDDDVPLANQKVRLVARLKDSQVNAKRSPYVTSAFDVDELQAVTDEQGIFEFDNVPQQIQISMAVQLTEDVKVDGSDEGSRSLGTRFFQPDEKRPLDVIRLKLKADEKQRETIAEILANKRLDCKLSGTHLLVGLGGDGKGVRAFLKSALYDYDENKALLGYLPYLLDANESDKSELIDYLQQRHWDVPGGNTILLAILDSSEMEIGILQLDITVGGALDTAAKFIRDHAPSKADAQQKLNAAFAEAKSSGRNVWLQFSQTRCAPCFSLSRWLDSQKSLLQRDYVMLKIDTALDEH